MDIMRFYRGRRVFVTGHTGFKGSWLCRMLIGADAAVTGYALEPPDGPCLFRLSDVEAGMRSVVGDVRDFDRLRAAFEAARPEVVIHLAAQPLVRESYRSPRETYETNVLGTVNLLECVRLARGVGSVLNVTTDKVYRSVERPQGYREDEPLDGYDPYSNSKSCSELATHSYAVSFFGGPDAPAVSTARAGNVIGGGDFAVDRIIPDCVRAAAQGRAIGVRNPASIRPYQHVLEPLYAYLMIAARQHEDRRFAGWYNVGPDERDCLSTGALVSLFCEKWGGGARWVNRAETGAPHEAAFLRLNCKKLRETFGWAPRWGIERAVEMTCAWSRVWLSGGDVPAEMDREIREFLGEEYDGRLEK